MPRQVTTIATILGIATDRSRLVVAYLRSEYRTLDAISPAQIRKDYRDWINETINADAGLADKLAASYGF